MQTRARGPIALVGGAEWYPPSRPLDEWLLTRSGSKKVMVLPTAAVPGGRPDLVVEFARNYFAGLGAEVEGVMITDRREADDSQFAERIAEAQFIYIAGGEPGYLADTLRDSQAWRAILDASDRGAVLAGSSAGAMALCNPMVVPRSGLRAGLGLFEDLIVLPHLDKWKDVLTNHIETLPANGMRLVGIDESTGLVIEQSRCLILGPGSVTLYSAGQMQWTKKGPAEMEDCV